MSNVQKENTKPVFLYLDAAVDQQRAGLSRGDKWLGWAGSEGDKRNANALHVLIQQLMMEHNFSLEDTDALVVNNGPGSYTGLRMALSAGKGICFALSKPLILLNTLEIMALSLKNRFPEAGYFLPMIDARRMEVFSALYNSKMEILMEPGAYELTNLEFPHMNNKDQIICAGNGSNKFINMNNRKNILFTHLDSCHTAMMESATAKFDKNDIADLAYAVPFYLKAFYTIEKK